jgi:Ankyrin repeat.
MPNTIQIIILNALCITHFNHTSGGTSSGNNLSKKYTIDLFQAIINGNFEYAKRAINKGAHINTLKNFGYTPLHAAINTKSIKLVRLLLHNGANIYIPDDAGNTALQLAKNMRIKNISKLINKINNTRSVV